MPPAPRPRRNPAVLALVGAAAMLLLGCSHPRPQLAAEGPQEPRRDAVPVRGPEGWGHLCPVAPDEAWSAWHVFQEAPHIGMFIGPAGTPGTAQAVYRDKRRDLVVVQSKGGIPFPVSFPRAASAPAVGSRVTITGYGSGFVRKSVTAKLLSVTAGSLVYDDTPGPGSSGSCVLNEQSEVVGINTAARQRGEGSGRWEGVGHAIYGDWADVPAEFRETVVSY